MSNIASVPPASAASAELSEAVRSWVHFDNLAESLNKQVANVRTLRNQFETKIMNLMDHAGLRNATLKITGAVLQRTQRFKQNELSWSFLEEQLHEYYKGRQDETAEVIAFIQRNRGGKTVECLKKSSVSPASQTPRVAPSSSNEKTPTR